MRPFARLAALTAVVAAIAAPLTASAAAPEPKKPMEVDRFMGRWYEILRTPNDMQKNCFAADEVWSRNPNGNFSIVQSCHRDSPSGATRVMHTSARILDPGRNAKFLASFMAGIFKQQYWVLDRADDYAWCIVGTPEGKYVWLIAREPELPAGQVASLKTRIKALGYSTGDLQASGSSPKEDADSKDGKTKRRGQDANRDRSAKASGG